MDAFECLDYFETNNIKLDLCILHPPCTALCVAGNSTYGEGKARYQERLDSVEWTVRLWNRAKEVATRVALENPIGVLQRLGNLPKPSYVHPYEHGHLEQKKTCLHLHRLPPLLHTNNVKTQMDKLPKNQRQRLHYLPPSKDRAKLRSKTFVGIAKAMAEQWLPYIKAMSFQSPSLTNTYNHLRSTHISTVILLAKKVGRKLDENYLEQCPIAEIEQLRDNLIETYNMKTKKGKKS